MSDEAQGPSVVVKDASGPGCLVQALWFLFVGWWLGGLAISLAWFLNVTIIGLPLGMAILNNVPKLLALQNPEKHIRITTDGSTTLYETAEQEQLSFLIRALFFLVVGWWWSGLWLAIAFFLCGTIILMPFGLKMFRMTPMMTTLRRY
jgi:uncharacterized membrane protein YccF (DUF307 family)